MELPAAPDATDLDNIGTNAPAQTAESVNSCWMPDMAGETRHTIHVSPEDFEKQVFLTKMKFMEQAKAQNSRFAQQQDEGDLSYHSRLYIEACQSTRSDIRAAKVLQDMEQLPNATPVTQRQNAAHSHPEWTVPRETRFLYLRPSTEMEESSERSQHSNMNLNRRP